MAIPYRLNGRKYLFLTDQEKHDVLATTEQLAEWLMLADSLNIKAYNKPFNHFDKRALRIIYEVCNNSEVDFSEKQLKSIQATLNKLNKRATGYKFSEYSKFELFFDLDILGEEVTDEPTIREMFKMR